MDDFTKNLNDSISIFTRKKMEDKINQSRRNHKKISIGLGDAVSFVATPIARVLGLSCIDPETKQLRPESPCAKRKAALNRIAPLN